jgi:hypothetical protein
MARHEDTTRHDTETRLGTTRLDTKQVTGALSSNPDIPDGLDPESSQQVNEAQDPYVMCILLS